MPICRLPSDARRRFIPKSAAAWQKKAAAAFGGVASYHTDTQAKAIVTKLTMN